MTLVKLLKCHAMENTDLGYQLTMCSLTIEGPEWRGDRGTQSSQLGLWGLLGDQGRGEGA
jgi:hypothetical protein